MRLPACSIPFFLAVSTPARAQEAPRVDAASAAAFGDELLRGDDPFNALTWYRLALFLGTDDEKSPPLWFRVALCYELGKRYDAAGQAWLDLAGRFPEWSPRATYRAALTALAAEHFAESRLYMEEVTTEAPGTEWAERASFLVPVIDLRSGNGESARTGFVRFADAYPDSTLAPRAKEASELLFDPVRHRSAAVAGVMSTVIPGSGQIYAGHTGDGVMAFLANGTLGFWTYTLLRDGLEEGSDWQIPAGAVIGGMTLLSWSANVIGAERGARRANQHAERRRADEVLRATDDPRLERDPEDVALP